MEQNYINGVVTHILQDFGHPYSTLAMITKNMSSGMIDDEVYVIIEFEKEPKPIDGVRTNAIKIIHHITEDAYTMIFYRLDDNSAKEQHRSVGLSGNHLQDAFYNNTNICIRI